MGFSEEVSRRVLNECAWDVNKASSSFGACGAQLHFSRWNGYEWVMLGPFLNPMKFWPIMGTQCLDPVASSYAPNSWRLAPDGHDGHDGPGTMAPWQAIDQLLLTEVPEGADGMEDSIDDRGGPPGQKGRKAGHRETFRRVVEVQKDVENPWKRMVSKFGTWSNNAGFSWLPHLS